MTIKGKLNAQQGLMCPSQRKGDTRNDILSDIALHVVSDTIVQHQNAFADVRHEHLIAIKYARTVIATLASARSSIRHFAPRLLQQRHTKDPFVFTVS